jgi:hypothetical protein
MKISNFVRLLASLNYTYTILICQGMNNSNGKSPFDANRKLAETLILEDLQSGFIPLQSNLLGPKDAFRTRAEYYERVDYLWFRQRLNTLRKKIIKQNNTIAFEVAALQKDLSRRQQSKNEANANNTVNKQGNKTRWDGSKASQLLSLDIDDKKHETMQPHQLYNSRPEYYEHFSLTVFRKHIYQEINSRKYIAYLENKKINKTKKSHPKL